MKEKGLKGVELVVSDGNKGIQESVTGPFLDSAWQFRHAYFLRNLMKLIREKKLLSVMQIIKQAL